MFVYIQCYIANNTGLVVSQLVELARATHERHFKIHFKELKCLPVLVQVGLCFKIHNSTKRRPGLNQKQLLSFSFHQRKRHPFRIVWHIHATWVRHRIKSAHSTLIGQAKFASTVWLDGGYCSGRAYPHGCWRFTWIPMLHNRVKTCKLSRHQPRWVRVHAPANA